MYFLDCISFSTSKENCSLMYYIIHSVIMTNHRRLLHVNNYIFKSSLVDDAPGNNHLFILCTRTNSIKILINLILILLCASINL